MSRTNQRGGVVATQGVGKVIIKLDENLGRPHVALLKRHGYDADRVFDQGLVVDAELRVRVKREGRFLITLNSLCFSKAGSLKSTFPFR